MKRILVFFTMLFTVILIQGCSDKIDNSSPEMTSATIDKILKDKDEVEILKFKEGYNSILSYAFAKTHDGKTLNTMNAQMALALGIMLDSLNSRQDAKITEMNSIVNQITQGMTYDDVVDAKDEYDKKTKKLVDERALKEKEARAKIAEQRAIQAEIQRKELEERQKANAALMKQQQKDSIKKEIAYKQGIIEKNETSLNELKEQMKPHEAARKGLENVKVDNIEFVEKDGKKWFMNFNITNDSEYEIIGYDFRIVVQPSGYKETKRNFHSNSTSISAGDTLPISHSLTSTSAKRVDDVNELSHNIIINDFVFLIDGNQYSTNSKVLDNLLARSQSITSQNESLLIEIKNLEKSLEELN